MDTALCGEVWCLAIVKQGCRSLGQSKTLSAQEEEKNAAVDKLLIESLEKRLERNGITTSVAKSTAVLTPTVLSPLSFHLINFHIAIQTSSKSQTSSARSKAKSLPHQHHPQETLSRSDALARLAKSLQNAISETALISNRANPQRVVRPFVPQNKNPNPAAAQQDQPQPSYQNSSEQQSQGRGRSNSDSNSSFSSIQVSQDLNLGQIRRAVTTAPAAPAGIRRTKQLALEAVPSSFSSSSCSILALEMVMFNMQRPTSSVTSIQKSPEVLSGVSEAIQVERDHQHIVLREAVRVFGWLVMSKQSTLPTPPHPHTQTKQESHQHAPASHSNSVTITSQDIAQFAGIPIPVAAQLLDDIALCVQFLPWTSNPHTFTTTHNPLLTKLTRPKSLNIIANNNKRKNVESRTVGQCVKMCLVPWLMLMTYVTHEHEQSAMLRLVSTHETLAQLMASTAHGALLAYSMNKLRIKWLSSATQLKQQQEQQQQQQQMLHKKSNPSNDGANSLEAYTPPRHSKDIHGLSNSSKFPRRLREHLDDTDSIDGVAAVPAISRSSSPVVCQSEPPSQFLHCRQHPHNNNQSPMSANLSLSPPFGPSEASSPSLSPVVCYSRTSTTFSLRLPHIVPPTQTKTPMTPATQNGFVRLGVASEGPLFVHSIERQRTSEWTDSLMTFKQKQTTLTETSRITSVGGAVPHNNITFNCNNNHTNTNNTTANPATTIGQVLARNHVLQADLSFDQQQLPTKTHTRTRNSLTNPRASLKPSAANSPRLSPSPLQRSTTTTTIRTTATNNSTPRLAAQRLTPTTSALPGHHQQPQSQSHQLLSHNISSNNLDVVESSGLRSLSRSPLWIRKSNNNGSNNNNNSLICDDCETRDWVESEPGIPSKHSNKQQQMPLMSSPFLPLCLSPVQPQKQPPHLLPMHPITEKKLDRESTDTALDDIDIYALGGKIANIALELDVNKPNNKHKKNSSDVDNNINDSGFEQHNNNNNGNNNNNTRNCQARNGDEGDLDGFDNCDNWSDDDDKSTTNKHALSQHHRLTATTAPTHINLGALQARANAHTHADTTVGLEWLWRIRFAQERDLV